MLVEYRSSKAEKIRWRDQKTGQALEASVLRHTVENASGSMVVNERVDDKMDVEHYQPPFSKGERVVLTLTEYKVERGMIQTRGKLDKLEDNGEIGKAGR